MKVADRFEVAGILKKISSKLPLDKEYVTEVLNFFHGPGKGIVEIRILPKEQYLKLNGSKEYVGKTVSGYYNRFERIAKAIEKFDGKANIYFTLNPVNPDLLARSANRLKNAVETTTRDDDIIADRWLPIDIDPKRPSGVSSTDAELELALDKQKDITEWLNEMKIPFIRGISGNGAHILIPLVAYSNNADTRKNKERFIKFLHDRFSDENVDVDKSVFNMGRIWKLYGTLACKGDSIPSRPHRRAYLEIPPKKLEPIDLYMMMDNIIPADWVPKDDKNEKTDTSNYHGRKDDTIINYLNYHGVKVRSIKPLPDKTIYILEKCPFNSSHNRGEVAVIMHKNGSIVFNCHHDSCETKKWKDVQDHLGEAVEFFKIKSISENNKETEIDEILTMALKRSPVLREKILKEIARTTGYTKKTLELQMRLIKKKQKGKGVNEDIANRILGQTESVKKIISRVKGDEVKFIITIKGQEFHLTEKDLRGPSKFLSKWVGRFEKHITITYEEWPDLVNSWMEMVQLGEEDEMSAEQIVQDMLIERLQNSESVDKETALTNPNTYYEERAIIYYASTHIQELLRDIVFKIDPKRLRNYLDSIMAGNSTNLRVGKGTKRFWPFKKDVILDNTGNSENSMEGM